METYTKLTDALNDTYNEVVAYVKEHQGRKGYIDCQPFGGNKRDVIYAIAFDEVDNRGVEEYVYGVKVENNELLVILEPIMNSYKLEYTEEDFNDSDAWLSVRWSEIYYVPTLFNIAECIEEYVED